MLAVARLAVVGQQTASIPKLTAHSTTISFFSFISTNIFYLHKIYQLNQLAPCVLANVSQAEWDNIYGERTANQLLSWFFLFQN